MKYIFISDIQWISKEIHMSQNGIIFHVSMWQVIYDLIFSNLSKYLVIQLGIF